MARMPEVFARPLAPEEAQRLVKITKSTRDRVLLRRSGTVLAWAQGRSAGEIAAMCSPRPRVCAGGDPRVQYLRVRSVVRKWSGCRSRKFGPAARNQICRIAACQPADLGLPFTTWSLTKLVDYLAEHARLVVST